MSDRISPTTWHRPTLRWAALILLAGTAGCGDEKQHVSAEAAEHGVQAEAADDGAPDAGRGEREKREAGERGEGEEGERSGPTRVSLPGAAYATARIAVEPARSDAASDAAGGVEVLGQVEFDPARVALISPRTSGRIERLLVVFGDRVRAGQTVALLYSPAFLTAQNDLIQARRRADVLAGTADAEGAQALLGAARRRLQLVGVGEATITRIEESGEAMSLLPIAAPFSGSIVEAMALAGAAVEAGTPLFKLADLSVVNVAADVPERLVRTLRIGQGTSIRVAALPDLAFAGRVARIGDQVDSETRTVKALVQVANRERMLKPGMFATVVLRGPGAAGDAAGSSTITIPASAVVIDGTARYVFVQVGPRTFERREVHIAPGRGPAGPNDRVVVLSGLTAGEPVVVRGAFTLKSELAKASFAEDEG